MTTETTIETNHALDQARAQYESISEMVERLEHARTCNCDYDDYLTDRDNCSQFDIIFDTEEEFNDHHNEDEARQAIQDDPLEISVRSGWCSPGGNGIDDMEAEDFLILLCTGGPACRIRGELSNGSPYRAWLEYQDWGTPWTRYFDAEQDTLLAYAQCFYFGE